MKLTTKNFNISHKKDNHLTMSNAAKVRLDYREKNLDNNITTNRPAQAISFGGSLNFVGNKVLNSIVQSKTINSLVNYTAENEAAFIAIYSLIFAGIIKPICVINQKGSDTKDKQYIATKNFLQAFIGSFLSFAVGGRLIKKATDIIFNNLKLIKVDSTRKVSLLAENYTDDAIKPTLDKLAQKALEKKYSTSSMKNKLAWKATEGKSGFERIGEFFKQRKAKLSFDFNGKKLIRLDEKANKILQEIPLNDELNKKALEIFTTAKKHIPNYQKNSSFVKDLIDTSAQNGKTTLYDAFEAYAKNSTGWITAIAKAKISSLLLPAVTLILFTNGKQGGFSSIKDMKKSAKNVISGKKNKTTATQQQNKEPNVLMNYLKPDQNNKTNNNISFKGRVGNAAVNGFAHIFEKAVLSSPSEKFTRGLSNLSPILNKPSARMGDIESSLITFYWVLNTTNSKKIDPDQKLGINIHTILVTIVSSISAFVLDTLLDGLIDKAKGAYKNLLENGINRAKESADFAAVLKENCSKLYNFKEIEKNIASNIDENTLKGITKNLVNTYGKKLSKFKSLVIFTAVVRFLVPVLAVPYSGKIKKMIKEKRKQKATVDNQ